MIYISWFYAEILSVKNKCDCLEGFENECTEFFYNAPESKV